MNAKEKFQLKNANRKLARTKVSRDVFLRARSARRYGFVGDDRAKNYIGMCTNGAFGQTSAGMYNELVQGTTGVVRELEESDLFDDQ